MLHVELPYFSDTASLFEHVADEPWAMLLDGGRAPGGRYDIIVARPWATVEVRSGVTVVTRAGMETRRDDEPFAVLRELLGAHAPSTRWPFAGGAVGYLSYEFGRRMEGLPVMPGRLPEVALGIYDWALVVDHQVRRSDLVGIGRDPSTALLWPDLVSRLSAPAPVVKRAEYRADGATLAQPDRDGYGRAFARVQRYLHDGDCYQVNLARRFCTPVSGDPWEGYRRLRALSPAPFGAFMRLPGAAVLSASPERFLRLREGVVETRPIKGTRPRDAEPGRDAALAQALRDSAKDRAENLMIVDLLRNDLGRCCITGSVQVPELFKVENYAQVHHLVSTVTGLLSADHDAFDLLRACLPGGSITGAPKRRAMEIIAELEILPREVYCGAIGYVGYDGAMDMNVAIRTLVHHPDEAVFWAGGGLVTDSNVDDEFAETGHKAAAMELMLAGAGTRD